MSLAKTELAVVIPVYNEEEIIETVLDAWSRELNRLRVNFEIHVYNDGSEDNTLAILNDYSASIERIAVHDKVNSGHGPTVLRGYKENSDIEWILQIDSDDEVGPESFEPLWEKRESYDLLLGRRTNRASGGTVRAILSLLARSLVWMLFGSRVHDVNSPFRLMRGERFKELISMIPEDAFAPNVIITGAASKKGLRIFELPVKYRARKTGETSLNKLNLLRAAFKSLFQTIKFRLTTQPSLYR
jgi:dolichol-phosphate mannosyltransferase